MKLIDICISADNELCVTDESGLLHRVELTQLCIDGIYLLGVKLDQVNRQVDTWPTGFRDIPRTLT